MKTVFSPRHRGHANQLELMAGAIVPGFELPSRAEFIHDRILEVGLGDIVGPKEFDLSIAERVQAKDFLDFLPTVYPRWKELGREGTALAYTCPSSNNCNGATPPRPWTPRRRQNSRATTNPRFSMELTWPCGTPPMAKVCVVSRE